MSDPAAHAGGERELRRLNRALRMLSDSNQALIRITDESALLNEACRIAVEVGGYRMAWVGFPEQDERRTVRVAAVAGFERGYIEALGIVWADVPDGRGPAGTAIRTGQMNVIHDIRTDPTTVPWREAARERGYESVAALPLCSDGRTLGVLNIYAAGTEAFDAEELKILAELAGDLAFGLNALRTRAEHARAEERLHKSEEAFRAFVENSPDLILRFDREHRLTYVNPALCRTFGLPAEAFLNQPLGVPTRDAAGRETNAEGLAQARHIISAVFAGGEPRELEVRWPTVIGERTFSGRYFPERDRGGAVTSVLAIARDITERQRAEEEMRSVLRHARTMVMQSLVTAPEGWAEHGPAWGAAQFHWEAQFEDEAAAQEVMPLELAPGEPYYAGWVRAKHPDDLGPMSLTAARAFGTGAPSWRQEFRATDRDGRMHWFTQVVSITAVGRGRWHVTTINTDVTELKEAERERQAHLRLFENLDTVNRAIQRAESAEQMMRDVLDELLAIFECDRAWLVYPCDPEAPSWHVPMERTRPEYPGALALGVEVPMDAIVAGVLRIFLAADGPVKFGAGEAHPVPASVAEGFGVRSFVAMALHPKGEKPYVFGLHQCSHARVWTRAEEKLLREVGRRMTDALTSLLAQRSAQESQVRLELANRAARIGPWDWNLVTNGTHFSAEWKRQLGYADHEIGNHYNEWESRLHPDDRVRAIAAARAFLAGERPDYEVEFRLRHKDGSYRWIFTRGEILRTPEGRPYRMIGCHLDITERKGAEETLRESRQAYVSLVNTVDGIVWELDVATFRFTFVSQQAERLLGYPVERWLTEPTFWQEHLHPEDRGWAIDYCVKATTEKRDHSFRYRMIAADGRVVWVHDIVTVVVEENRPAKLRGIIVDITESKAAEEALRWRTALFEAQVDSTLDGILVVDGRGTKILQNERMNELWKIPREIAEDGDDAVQLRHVASRTKNPAEFAAKVAHLYAHPEEVSRDELALVDGTVLDRYSAPVRDRSGKHYGRIWTFRDITETKRLEEQLRQSQKMEAVGQLAGGIAHDFNNLLTVVQMQTTLLLSDKKLDAETGQSVRQILDAATRAANLTRQLLTFSRQSVKQARTLDLGEVVTGTTKLLRRVLGEHIRLESHFVSGLPLVHADPGMMEQVLMNLVINARDAMPDGGQLVIALEAVTLEAAYAATHPPARSGRFVRLSVSDSGSGIAAENLPHIFEPFFTTKEIGKGTGLGLATVFGILQQHHGWIEVESEPGRGSTFRVFLPPVESAVIVELPAPVAKAGGGTETVLVVEDEAMVRAVAVAALRRRGYRVIEAAMASDALRHWDEQQGKIDLLLTDLIMPGGVSGRQLAADLSVRRPVLKVVFTSGYSGDAAGPDLALTVGQNFLPKPYTLEELVTIVRRKLDGK